MSKLKVIIGQPANGSGGGAVDSVNGKTGVVVLDGTDIELLNGGGVTVTQAIVDLETDIDGKVNEAPQDGKQYARKDANWVEVQGGAVDSVNSKTGDVVLDGTDIPLLTGTTNPTVTEAIADIENDIDGKVSSVVAGANVEVNNADTLNPIVSAFPTTTAGILDRTYFTGDTETIGAGTFYKSNRDGKGTVATATQTVTVNDNQKDYFAQDLISDPYPIDTTIYAGSYSGILNGLVSANGGEQKFYVEIYKTDINGNPVASGITGAPVGDLGVTVIAIAESGLIDLRNGDETQFSITAELTENISLLTTNRVRYHVAAEKVGTTGGIIDISTSYGNAHVCHLDVPVQSLTSTVINNDPIEFPSTATQFDLNRNFKVNIDANTAGISANAIEIINLDGSKVSSLTDNEPTGSDVIFNVVSLTQAEYDAGTPIATTFYLITDA